MNKKIAMFLGLTTFFFIAVKPAFAHVTVKPNQVGVAAFQTFTMGVPNETDSPVVSLRLLIPEGLNFVSPNVKPGWSINIKKTGEGEDAKVTEINWTGGSIPEGQRDEFNFSAQVPASETSLNWKAYQTYRNGEVVSWDQDPKNTENLSDSEKEALEKEGKGPFSITAVINDLAVKKDGEKSKTDGSSKIAWIALALSAVSLGLQFYKKKEV